MSVLRHSLVALVAVVVAVTGLHAQGAAEKAAEVDGAPILAADVDAELGNELGKLQEEIFALRESQLNTMIDRKLLEAEAAKRGVTIAALAQSEISSRVTPVTDEEVGRFYEENKAKLQGDRVKVEAQVKSFLNAQRLEERQKEFLASLRAAAKIAIFLAPPPVFRSEVTTTGAPVRGAADAPVTIVEFSDFHCPFCRRVQPVLDQLRTKYGNKIKIVFRDFPLESLHPQARAASEAAGCANEQGKFWEFHDVVFKNDSDASAATLDRFAKEVGMDVSAFEACRVAGKYKTAVEASNLEGSRLGITGTPTFFINGRILVGAQPIEGFARIIDEELALMGSRELAGAR